MPAVTIINSLSDQYRFVPVCPDNKTVRRPDRGAIGCLPGMPCSRLPPKRRPPHLGERSLSLAPLKGLGFPCVQERFNYHAQRERWVILNAWDYPLFFPRKKSSLSHVIDLLTRSLEPCFLKTIWCWPRSCLRFVMDWDAVEVNKQAKKELVQYPALLHVGKIKRAKVTAILPARGHPPGPAREISLKAMKY